SVGPGRSCDFSSGKIILQQEIAPEQIRKLLAEGRTDLLPGFISMRTRRKFKAYLVRGADGKVGFEFEPRPAKAGAKAGKRGSTADQPEAVTETDAPKKAGAKKAAAKAPAKKPAAKKAAARKAGAKKPAAKKSAAKKPAAKKAATAKPASKQP